MGANLDGGKPGSRHQMAAMSAGSRADAAARQAWQLAGGWTGVCRQTDIHRRQFTVTVKTCWRKMWSG